LREIGKVLFFDEARGFGFIRPDGDGPDIFVHATGIVDDEFRVLYAADVVEYDVEVGPRGPRAVNVARVQAKD
jgi:CspA family cold shock protein